jgi:hypothetical protein
LCMCTEKAGRVQFLTSFKGFRKLPFLVVLFLV